MTRTTAVAAGAVLIVAQIAILAAWAVLRDTTTSAAPIGQARADATEQASTPAVDRRLRRIEDSIARMGERMDRLAGNRPGAPPRAEDEQPASGRRRVEPAAETVRLTTGTPDRDPRLADISTRLLELEADERLTRGDDVAGAVARYEIVLDRASTTQAQASAMRKLGLAYLRLGRREKGVEFLREAVRVTNASSQVGADSRFDLLRRMVRNDDATRREYARVAREYVGSTKTNATGREAIHFELSQVAEQLGDTALARTSLRYLAESSGKWKQFAESGLARLDRR